MFSLQKLFARDQKLFELMEASAKESCASVQALKNMLGRAPTSQSLDEFIVARRKDKQITVEINELLARSSVTSLDREDIEAITNVLYKIPKTVEKFAERYVICASQIREVNFGRHVVLMERATLTVAAMVSELEKSHFETVKKQNDDLQIAEGEADKLMNELLAELYSGKYPPLTVMMLKDLYEILEKVMDRCRDVGNVIANVVLKNS